MGFLDSSSSIVTAILTRKGRELLAKNDGSFRITKFSFSDDEINYQLYSASTDDDTDILNLPVLEPSSNELTALRFRLVTAPKGTLQSAFITVNPNNLNLVSSTRRNNPAQGMNQGALLVVTNNGSDSAFQAVSRDQSIASVRTSINPTTTDAQGHSTAIILVNSGNVIGSTFIDIMGRDTGALVSVPVSNSTFSTEV